MKMIHEYELKHEGQCTTDTTHSWQVEVGDERGSANFGFIDANELIDQCEKWKARGFVVKVTEVEITVKQTTVTDFYGHKF